MIKLSSASALLAAILAVSLVTDVSFADTISRPHRGRRGNHGYGDFVGHKLGSKVLNRNENIIKIGGGIKSGGKHHDKHKPGKPDGPHITGKPLPTVAGTTTTPKPILPTPTACGHTRYLNAGEIPGSTPLTQSLGIVGGQSAKEDEFPWQAVVIFNTTWAGGLPWQCGASVISEDYLLTTGTCCMMGGNFTLQYYPPATVYYGIRQFGQRTFNPFSGEPLTYPTDFAAARQVFAMMVPDRSYASAMSIAGLIWNNDYCIIQVDEPVKFDTWRIQPICLPQTCDGTCKIGDEVIVSGGGDTGLFLNQSFSTPDKIKYVKTKILDRDRCQRQIEATRLTITQLIWSWVGNGVDRKKRQSGGNPFIIIELIVQLLDSPYEICYSGQDAGNYGTSFGDEGGPAACLRDGNYYSLDYMQTINRLLTIIIELITNDPTCGDPTKIPGVISSVCAFVPWIKSVTGLAFLPSPPGALSASYSTIAASASPYQCGHTQYWNVGENFETFSSPTTGLGISGATAAKKHEFPWQVVIKNCQGTYCGGVVIAPNWVLTSADCCFQFYSEGPTIYYGVTDFNYDSASYWEPAYVEKRRPCDAYFAQTTYARYLGNLCLLKVHNPVSFSKWSIQPICMPKNCQSDNTCTPDDPLIISGFGQTKSVPNHPATLQSATVPLINYAKCRKAMYQVCPLDKLAWADVGCYNADDAATHCGDEGGPISCYKRGYHQLDYLQTIDKLVGTSPEVSFTARVCAHMPWIRAATRLTFDEDTRW